MPIRVTTTTGCGGVSTLSVLGVERLKRVCDASQLGRYRDLRLVLLLQLVPDAIEHAECYPLDLAHLVTRSVGRNWRTGTSDMRYVL